MAEELTRDGGQVRRQRHPTRGGSSASPLRLLMGDMPLPSSCRLGAQRYIRWMMTLEWWQCLPMDPNNPDAEPIPNFEQSADESPATRLSKPALLGMLAREL